MKLDASETGIVILRGLGRPPAGWLRAAREAAGLSAGEVGRRLGVSRQLPLQFERAEAADTITLKSLRAVAAALGCELVYALVPLGDAQQLRSQRSSVLNEAAEESAAPRQRHQEQPLLGIATDSHFCD